MDYLILNEESLPFASQAECDNNLPAFMSVVAAAFDNRFDPGWYQITMEYYRLARQCVSAYLSFHVGD